MTPFARGIGLSLLVIAGDQVSKELAMATLLYGGVTYVPGFVDLTLIFNMGAAFGMFAKASESWRLFFLTSVSVVASVGILYLLYREKITLAAIALGLLLGGAVGNLIDRVRFGKVVDFIHLHWHDISWPVFNLADSAITVGVILLLWENFFPSKEES